MARKTSNRERGPSQRQLRVGEEIRHVLAGVMMRGELHDPALDRRVGDDFGSPDQPGFEERDGFFAAVWRGPRSTTC